jgi:hypothetical protein
MRFIRDFFVSDFVNADGTPYTVLHEGKKLLEFWTTHDFPRAFKDYTAYTQNMKELFNRTGPLYNFGPFPVVWNAKVWNTLSQHLISQGSNILDAIAAHPHEASWYGESLLKFNAIPLLPKEPLFKAYLYLEEFEYDRRFKLDEEKLATFYIGVVYQSNWYPKRLNPIKRLSYKFKRLLERSGTPTRLN